MTIKKAWLIRMFIALTAAALIGGCAGKKKSADANPEVGEVEDITAPPQIITPKGKEEE